VEDVIEAAKVAEATQAVIDQATTSTTTDVDRMIGELAASRIVAEANNQEIRKLTDQLAKQPTVRNISRSPSPSSQRGQSPARRRVTFADDGPQRTYRQSSQSSCSSTIVNAVRQLDACQPCYKAIVEVITSLVDNFVMLITFSVIVVRNSNISHVVAKV